MKIFKIYLLLLPLLGSSIAQNFIEHPIDEIPDSVFRSIALEDLDNDGNKDIAATLNGNEQLAVWFAEGNGNFNAPVFLENEPGSSGKNIEFTDLNNDGNEDIVTIITKTAQGLTFERVVYYLNNGDRTFSNVNYVDVNSGTSIQNVIALIDVNNNGFKDIVLRLFSPNVRIGYYPNLGNGTFGPAVTLINDISNREVYASDLDNDGLDDMIIGSTGSPQLYINSGNGTFTINDSLDDFPIEQTIISTLSGLVNNDGNEDILFTGTDFVGTAGIFWYSNNGGGSFSIEELITNPSMPASSYTSVEIADLNGDGVNDLVATTGFNTGSGIPYWIKTGDNTYSSELVITDSDDSEARVQVEDFNIDGKIDFIVGTRDGKLTWFESNLNLSLEDKFALNLQVFPNPSNSIFEISSNILNEKYDIIVINGLGQIINTLKEGSLIDLTRQPRGVYFAKIKGTTSSFEITKKLVKI